MQFFILIVINIFMWVIFYLVISLKLEKTASQFREKKLRKIMDEIMIEFNSTAERNISILENRISTMKKLLEKAGGTGGVDVTCIDDKVMVNAKNYRKTKSNSEEEQVSGREKPAGGSRPDGQPVFSKLIEASMNYIDRARNVFHKVEDGEIADSVDDVKGGMGPEKPTVDEGILAMGRGIDNTSDNEIIEKIEIDVAELDVKSNADDGDAPGQDSDDDTIAGEGLITLFEKSDNKYALIRELNGRGFAAEDLSKYSGIPLGEIKLVLNLGNSR